MRLIKQQLRYDLQAASFISMNRCENDSKQVTITGRMLYNLLLLIHSFVFHIDIVTSRMFGSVVRGFGKFLLRFILEFLRLWFCGIFKG